MQIRNEITDEIRTHMKGKKVSFPSQITKKVRERLI